MIPKEHKTVLITLRVSESEKRIFEDCALRFQMTLSQLIRLLMHQQHLQIREQDKNENKKFVLRHRQNSVKRRQAREQLGLDYGNIPE